MRTVHGFGYAFDAEATEETPRRGPAAIAAHLTWNRRTIVLLEGENVMGRDPDVAVRIEAPGVSRRHARILAAGGRFTLEDLGSKNGTYLREQRLSRPIELADGDAFVSARPCSSSASCGKAPRPLRSAEGASPPQRKFSIRIRSLPSP